MNYSENVMSIGSINMEYFNIFIDVGLNQYSSILFSKGMVA